MKTVKWTPEYVEILRTNAGKLSAGNIAKLIPYATRSSVIGKMSRLGLVGQAQGRYDREGPKRKREVRRVPGGTGPKIDNPTGGRKLSRVKDNEHGAQFQLVPVADIAIDLPDFVCNPVSLLNLAEHQCRWPMDGGLYCGLPQIDNEYRPSPYCRTHHAHGHKPVSEHRRLNKR